MGAGLVVLASAALVEYHQHALDFAETKGKVAGRAEQQKNDDQQLADLKKSQSESDARNAQLQQALQNLTSKQIVQKAPQYISGIPSSSRPITIFGPSVAAPKEGDAIVPADQIKPIAAQILAGNKCMNDDLPNCAKQVTIWTDKYNLRDQDAKDWEKVAKGGGFSRKLKRCGILAGAGFGIGYAPNDPQNRVRNGAIGAGAVGISCLFIR